MNEFTAELIGTAVLILLGGGVCSNVSLKKALGNGSGWIVITTGWALAVFAGVVIAGPVSGAHLNPAVTIGLALANKFEWSKVPLFILAQLLGAMIGAFLNWAMYKDHFDASSDDPSSQLGVFSTGAVIPNTFRNVLSEVLGTFVLVFCVFYFADASGTAGTAEVKIGLGSVGALPVAFIVWSIGLSLGGTTGYAINPARDLGPRIMHAILPMKGKGGSNWGYAWVPIVGPLLGATIAALLFNFLSN